MKLDVKFTELTNSFETVFGEVHNISDGGFERGYAEGETKGYEKGYTEGEVKGFADGETVGYNKGYADGELVSYDKGHADGVKSEYDRFWDVFQNYGNKTDYAGAFKYWEQEIFKPKYSFILAPYGPTQMFQYSYITDIITPLKERGLVLDTSGCSGFTQMFQGAKVEHIPTLDLRKANNTSYMFGSGCKVVTIDKLIVSETTPLNQSVFDGSQLENITFEGVIGSDVSFSYCKKLTYESLMSIINALKDFSGTSETRTCTLGEANLAKLTDAEKAIATEKGWTLA